MKKISLLALFLTAGLSAPVIGANVPNISQNSHWVIVEQDPAPAPAPAPTPAPAPPAPTS